MTSLLKQAPMTVPWWSMPGWGIVADLTPPELIASRSLKTLRRLLVAVLAVVVALCAAAYVLTSRSNGAAHDSLDAANARTSQLLAEQASNAIVTQVKGATTGLQGQLQTLFAADVDVASVMQRVRAALPKGMTITSMSVAPVSGTSLTVGTDTVTQVGTITVLGSAEQLDDLATYASVLGSLPGLVNVIPTSNSKSGKKSSWSLTAVLTSELLSHRFSPAGGH